MRGLGAATVQEAAEATGKAAPWTWRATGQRGVERRSMQRRCSGWHPWRRSIWEREGLERGEAEEEDGRRRQGAGLRVNSGDEADEVAVRVAELVREQRSSGTRAREAARSSGWSRYLATRTPGLGSSAAGCRRRSSCSRLLLGVASSQADGGARAGKSRGEDSGSCLSRQQGRLRLCCGWAAAEIKGIGPGGFGSRGDPEVGGGVGRVAADGKDGCDKPRN